MGNLQGKRVVVTRPRESAAEFSALLRARGAAAIEWPLIEIAPALDKGVLAAAADNAANFDWLLFSSANGVRYFFETLKGRKLSLVRIGAIGPKTAAALTALGHKPDAMPSDFQSHAFAEALGDVKGKSALLVRSEIALPDLSHALLAKAMKLEEVVAYRTIAATSAAPFAWNDADVLTFASGSAAQSLAQKISPASLPAHLVVASIGPSTTKVASELGFTVAVEAEQHTAEGLTEALDKFPGLREKGA